MFHTKIMLVLYFFSSILLSVELLLTQETRFSKSCSHWKFCFNPPNSASVSGENVKSLALLVLMFFVLKIRECGSTLYVGLARAVSPSNTNFRLTFLLTRLQEALYEDLPV